MEQLQAILNYQAVDSKLYKLEREIMGSEERKDYVKLKKFLETAPEKLDALEVKATSLKTEAQELAKKYSALEASLKDFENLDELVTSGADIAFYRKKAQSLVDQIKKLKADLANVTAAVKTTDAEYQKMKKQVISAQKQYVEAAEKYKVFKASRDGEKKTLETELAKLAKEVPSALLETYATKRKEKIFPIVGEMAGNRCPFCSMEPPLAAINKLASGATIECDNCHRLIFKK